MSANHAGIDIGANEGTKIVAAMDGEATLVSQEGDYGNHIKITNGNVTTLYAHCKSLYINQGERNGNSRSWFNRKSNWSTFTL